MQWRYDFVAPWWKNKMLPDDIRQRLRADFGSDADQACSRLQEVFTGHRFHSASDAQRIVRCLVRLANGDAQKLDHYARAALADARDVISWAEYDVDGRRTHDLSIGFGRLASAPPDCVGALIRNERGQVFVQRRAPTQRVFPGVWDIVGGHLEKDETEQVALAREINEETGWELSRIVAQLSDWTWEHAGVVRQEVDYLVEVTGDLRAPRLAPKEHDAYAWVGVDDVDLMMEGRVDGDGRLRDIVIKALRWDDRAQ